MKSSIIATGSYRPEHRVTNADYEAIMDTSDAWIVKRTGIRERRFESLSTTHMATKAAEQALKDIDVSSIDCIIVGTYTPDSFIPTVANAVRANLGITRPIPSFDLNAACSGFLYAYQTAHAYIAANLYKRILVIGVDFNSRYLDYTDRGTAILFGDGAGCVVLEASESGYIDGILGGETDEIEAITMANTTDYISPFLNRQAQDNPYFAMKGAEVFKFAVRTMDTCIRDILDKNQMSIDDVDYVIAHQANQRILDSAARSLKLPAHKVLSNVEDVGNTSSGSVPLLLDEVNRQGLLKKGMKIIMIGFGGGLTYGCILLEWTIDN